MEWCKKSQLHVIEIVSALSFQCDNYFPKCLDGDNYRAGVRLETHEHSSLLSYCAQ